MAAACTALGFWQLDRLRTRRARNDAAIASRALPPTDLNAVARAGDGGAGPLAERRVTAEGRYDPAHEIVLRGQVYRGTPGVYIATPLRLSGSDSAVLVTRGFAPSPDALTVDLAALAADTSGTVRVAGLAETIPIRPDGGQALTHRGRESFRRLDLAALRARLPYPILDVTIIEIADSAGTDRAIPRRLPAPALDDGPHLNYALQWFAFATLAGVFAGIFVRGRGTEDGGRGTGK